MQGAERARLLEGTISFFPHPVSVVEEASSLVRARNLNAWRRTDGARRCGPSPGASAGLSRQGEAEGVDAGRFFTTPLCSKARYAAAGPRQRNTSNPSPSARYPPSPLRERVARQRRVRDLDARRHLFGAALLNSAARPWRGRGSLISCASSEF